MALTLARHTSPLATGICYGRTDVALAASFAAEAEALLAELGPLARIVSSPQPRCLRLAELLAERLALPCETDDDLREMDFGTWEGTAWDAIPRPELDAWAADLLGARPHGGESVAMLLARARPALARCRAAGAPTLAVTHAGVIRAAFAAAGMADPWRRPVPFARAILIADTATTRLRP